MTACGDIRSSRPVRGLSSFPWLDGRACPYPTAFAVGHIMPPLRGWEGARSADRRVCVSSPHRPEWISRQNAPTGLRRLLEVEAGRSVLAKKRGPQRRRSALQASKDGQDAVVVAAACARTRGAFTRPNTTNPATATMPMSASKNLRLRLNLCGVWSIMVRSRIQTSRAILLGVSLECLPAERCGNLEVSA